ncbi:LytR C-terminal domain-containing protein [Actinoplanes sp. KI2]|uniref:LytR C-terminal domain-containing protein n=1 Tax=Actinoplanes sp. KI2 TaxID=2983315 RepID=UPI0021D5F487|nr:LytR C-terminal domain-containing protein [Actinoplanes sp. KI2]MCU7725308.1 LytR C-terminal domain-containing protein [Actinoplanes sp. KI2]
MSTPLRDRLRELEAEARQVKVLPAAAVRARGRRRAWRQRMAVAAAVAVVAAGGGFAATHTGTHQPAVTPLDKGLTCTLSLPDDPAQVKVRVIDGGAAAGMADKALTGLRNRRFTVTTGSSQEAGNRQGDVVLRYGPAAIGNATLLRAYFPGVVTMIFDPSRHDDVVDLTVGPRFTAFHTTTEVNQFLAQEGEPTAPPQCTSFHQR